MAFTLKIKFSSWGKVYHFASMNHMGEKGDKVNVIKTRCSTPSFERYEEVIIVGHERGISPKATKWRTGSPVTASQRVQYKQPTARSTEIMEQAITVEEVMGAVSTFRKLQKSKALTGIGFSQLGQIYYSKVGSAAVSLTADSYNIRQLLNIVNVDPRKASLQNSLNELLAKAEEIKTKIGEL